MQLTNKDAHRLITLGLMAGHGCTPQQAQQSADEWMVRFDAEAQTIGAMATTAGQAAATRRGPHKHSGENWPQMKKQLADQHADHIRTIAAHASRSFHAYCHRVRELEKLGRGDLVPRFDDKEEL